MTEKTILDNLSIYVPQKKMEEKPAWRLVKLAAAKDR